ncbi:MAG: tRNA1Val (adenine37-N6)-methyltransferase [Salibacteraceae bacterium]|jgi:tRNA1Val (adenine37-N6)-methyltransferase
MDFKFKKFTISHREDVFKFGTDAALLATWAIIENAQSVLEIGCGSGVISLMLAQRNPKCNFTGIDLSKEAVELSNANASKFPFETIFEFQQSTLQEFKSNQKFDLIVSNPPFFENATKSPSELKNTTRHTDTLPLFELLKHSKRLLSDTGSFQFIYPSRYLSEIKSIATDLHFHINEIVFTQSTSAKPIKRVLVRLSNTESVVQESNLIINGDISGYSQEVFDRFEPFYLKL